MLVLQRKEGQSILIGEDIEIKFMAVNGHAVKIAIEAPRDVSIVRKELQEAIEANQSAVASDFDMQEIQAFLQHNIEK